jgi:phospholipase C
VSRAVEIDRRQFLAGLGVSLGAASIGCGSRSAAAPDAGEVDATVDAAIDAAIVPDAAASACTAASSDPATHLLAGIDTIVVLCMENRSFDHCLGALRLVEGRTDIDGLIGVEANLDGDGNAVAVHRLDNTTPADPPHNWGACHRQWNSGANDGFVVAHAGVNQADVMGYHVREQLPVTYALADAGAICHRWFSACLGPTWPNRFYLHAATSGGEKADVPMIGLGPTIWDRLADAGRGGINYFHDVPWALGGFGRLSGFAPIERFFEDAAAGALPPLAFIDPAFVGGNANDDHPSHDIGLGQALIASIVAALGASPQWSRCLFVLTYDEHGGFFDHVPPPGLSAEPYAEFATLGFRVPSLVIGPHVRRSCAIDTVLEHSSIAATVCRRFGLPPLNPRAELAADLSSCIDPRRLDSPLPPPQLPVVEISERGLAARQALAMPSHPELAAALALRPPPRELDRRAETDQVVRRVLRWGERLGVVRVR